MIKRSLDLGFFERHCFEHVFCSGRYGKKRSVFLRSIISVGLEGAYPLVRECFLNESPCSYSSCRLSFYIYDEDWFALSVLAQQKRRTISGLLRDMIVTCYCSKSYQLDVEAYCEAANG